MAHRDFSGGYPRVSQWVWIDEGKPWSRLGHVQAFDVPSDDLKITREGVRPSGGAAVTTVESTVRLSRRCVVALKDLPPTVLVCLCLPDGGFGPKVDVEVARLTPLLDRNAIPWARRRLMNPDWQPRP